MHIYTPILQIKKGELEALGELIPADKARVIPLIQLLPDAAEKRKGDYVVDRMKPIVTSWSFLDNRLYVDPYWIGDSQPSIMRSFFETLQNGLVHIIPVVRADSSDLIKEFIKSYLSYGVCIRMSSQFVSADLIDETIEKYQSAFSLSENEIDLLIDFGTISPDNESHFYNSFDLIYSRSTKITSLRKIIVAAGSFPSDLGKFEKHKIHEIPRVEWSLWKRLKKLVGDTDKLIYADYGNVNPTYDPDNSNHRGTCSIKYTTTDGFCILKGEKSEKSALGTGQYKEKSKLLIDKSYYSGNTFSWGDQYIKDCAEGVEKPGGSTTWVKITQNHHFVKMLRILRP